MHLFKRLSSHRLQEARKSNSLNMHTSDETAKMENKLDHINDSNRPNETTDNAVVERTQQHDAPNYYMGTMLLLLLEFLIIAFAFCYDPSLYTDIGTLMPMLIGGVFGTLLSESTIVFGSDHGTHCCCS